MLLFTWLEALFIEAIIWYYIFIIISVIILINSIIGFITVIRWIKERKTTKGYNKHNKSGLSKEEYEWLHSK